LRALPAHQVLLEDPIRLRQQGDEKEIESDALHRDFATLEGIGLSEPKFYEPIGPTVIACADLMASAQ